MTHFVLSAIGASSALLLTVPCCAHPHARSHARQGMSAAARVAAADRAAMLGPERNASDATQVYSYTEGSIYHVVTAPGRVTDIALEPGETLGSVASGDTVRWIIGDTTSGAGAGQRSHVLVKPVASGLSTNLVVTTDRRTYHLLLTSNAHDAATSIAWRYPADALIAVQTAPKTVAKTTPASTGFDVAALRFDYVISGDHPTWRPLRAFDDGVRTYIEFPAALATDEAPPLFVITDGQAELVNYRVDRRYYVVDRLFDVAELRLGTRHQQVVRISRATRGKGGA
ncbi:MAG: P-type conjugative transfer protein TrbG [Sphingomonas sp.]